MNEESFNILRNALESTLDNFLKSNEIKTMNHEIAGKIISCMPWNVLGGVLPDQANFFVESGFLRSLQQGVPVTRTGEPLPWINYQAIDLINQLLPANARVFEYGLGVSTIYYAKQGYHVFGVEADQGWYARVLQEFRHALPECDRAGLILSDSKDGYIQAVSSVGQAYDLIVVDGGWRGECVQTAIEYLNDYGVIVLDNSDSREYDGIFTYIRDAGFNRIDVAGLVPSLPFSNTTSFFCRSFDVLLSRREYAAASVTRFSSGRTIFQASQGMPENSP